MTKLNFIGPFNRTGYGQASIGYLNGILDARPDLDVSFTIIGGVDPNDQELKTARAQRLLSLVQKQPDWSAPSVCFWHLHDIPNQTSQCKGPVLRLTTFETDGFDMAESLAAFMEVPLATASNWGAAILRKNMHNMPEYAIDTPVPHAFKFTEKDTLPKIDPEDPIKVWNKILGMNLEPDTFIISAGGKWEVRKSHPELLDAVLEIGQQQNILLTLFCFNPFIYGGFPFSEFVIREMTPVFTPSGVKAFRKGKALVVMLPPTGTRAELHGGLSKAHFYVSASKGEGFDLPLFEMMSYGMPCIATLNTAHADYCSDDNVIPIESGPLVQAYDGKFFNNTKGSWYSVSKASIKTAILKAHKLKGDTKDISAAAHKVTGDFTWQKSSTTLLEIMKKRSMI